MDSRTFDVPRPLLPDIIAQHGRWSAGKPAVLCGDRSLSWAGFDRATNRVANGLLALGLYSGARAAVLMDNSIEMLLTLFGAARAGVSVVPLNVSISEEAVAAMIADSGAAAVFASGEHRARIDRLCSEGRVAAGVLRIAVGAGNAAGWIDFDAWHDSMPEGPCGVTVTPDTECNIIYSSGTTGLPKGIAHDHGCRMHWAADLALALRYHSGAVTVCSLGLYSNISWVAMLSTILVGGTLVILPAFSATALADEIERRGITHGALVPVQLARLLELPDLDRRRFDSLQAIMCCGSPLAVELKRAARDRLGCALIELYGLTEGIVTTLAPEDFERRIESVGKPIPGQQLAIVDEADRELAAGECGEIVGLGRLVMIGYHARPEASMDATWIDPQGRRWLRTGDIGRIDDEGFVTIVDRKKDMILSGSQNVYPADIELVMLGHPLVAEVAVVGVADPRWGETPVAVVVARAGAALAPAELTDWTNARLGRQQRIREVLLRDSLPRNPNGKVLKRELRRELAGG